MLAAQCVCGILQAEHSVIRQTVSTLAELTHGKPWRSPGPALTHLKSQVQHLRVFDRLCHSPKDKHLWAPLWGRSDEADLLLGSLEYTHERNADLLWRALTLLHAIERGESQLAADLVLTLRRHRLGMLKQMDIEEHDLMRLARRLLSEDEWAGIASMISSVPNPDGATYHLSAFQDDAAIERADDAEALLRRPLAPEPSLDAPALPVPVHLAPPLAPALDAFRPD